MGEAARKLLSYEDYLQLEQDSGVKHEWWGGVVVAMAGGTVAHALLSASALVALGVALRGGPCRPYSPDLKIGILTADRVFYPDTTVICGEPQLAPRDGNVATNPKLIVEVLSESSERFDRGEKFEHYRSLESLQHYLLIAQDKVRVELLPEPRRDLDPVRSS